MLTNRQVPMYREWAEMAGYLHEEGLFWMVADIIAELVPTGRAAVEAHKTLYDYLGCEWVCLPPATCLPCYAVMFSLAAGLLWNLARPLVRTSGESLILPASSSLSCTVPI